MNVRALAAPLRRPVLFFLFAVFTTLTLTACKSEASKERKRAARAARAFRRPAEWSPATLTAVKGVPIADIKTAIATRLAGERPTDVDAEAWKHTQSLYKRYGQTPLWLTSDGLANARARTLTDAVLGATNDALRVDDYPVAALANAIVEIKRAPIPTATQLADADVLLSATYAALAEDMLVGQVSPKEMAQSWHIDPQDENVDSAIAGLLGAKALDSAIAELRPVDEDYGALQRELLRYRELVAKGGWPIVPKGKTLKAGQRDSPARLAALRARLAAEGFAVAGAPAAQSSTPDTARGTALPTAASASGVYDEALAEAVGQFQSRHAITVDKRLSEETVNSLNVPAAYRLGQIAANLERYRWLPRDLGERYIYVNVPAFRLTAYDAGEPSLEMKVIVGQEFEDRATPVFSDSMETVVFRPYWNVTPNIQAKEIEPKERANPGYMAKENMEYYKDGGVSRIRQRPGPGNALGFVKFLFPNDYNIYLHDTPNHDLFNKDVRAFSHGCIRLEKPAELAQWVLGWDPARVQQNMDGGGDNKSTRLSSKLPVYITYGTAFVRDGQLHFGNDLYHRDDKLVQAAAAGALPSPRAVQALEALKRIASA